MMDRILLAQGFTRPHLDTGLHWGVSRWGERVLSVQSALALRALTPTAFSGCGYPVDLIRCDSHDSPGPQWVPVLRPAPRSHADARLSNRSER